jgi:hypothetical protein
VVQLRLGGLLDARWRPGGADRVGIVANPQVGCPALLKVVSLTESAPAGQPHVTQPAVWDRDARWVSTLMAGSCLLC